MATRPGTSWQEATALASSLAAMGIGLRICSLLPSATEIVFALGLGDRLVAVTHECDYPLEATRLPVITRSTLDHGMRHSREIHHHIASALHAGSSIYALDHALLERLDPTLILTQELCDVCAVSYDIVQRAVHRLRGTRTILSLARVNSQGQRQPGPRRPGSR